MPTSAIGPVSTLPPIRMTPFVALSRPATISIKVLLPQPLGPTTETNSPGWISILVGRKASKALSVSSPNTLLTLSISSRTPRVPSECMLSALTCTFMPADHFSGQDRNCDSGGR